MDGEWVELNQGGSCLENWVHQWTGACRGSVDKFGHGEYISLAWNSTVWQLSV